MARLVHGTTLGTALCAYLGEGLVPRNDRASLWKEHPSIAEHVYLTSAYGMYFARHASTQEHAEHVALFADVAEVSEEDLPQVAALVEIETDRLDPACLYPDEDVLAWALNEQSPGEFGEDIHEVTAFVRDNFDALTGCTWEDSLQAMGNCAYRGTIPAEAITRVVKVLDPTHPTFRFFHDPSISPLNFRFCGEMYVAQQHYFMHPDEDMPDGAMLSGEMLKKTNPALYADNKKRVHWEISSRLKVIYTNEEAA